MSSSLLLYFEGASSGLGFESYRCTIAGGWMNLGFGPTGRTDRRAKGGHPDI